MKHFYFIPIIFFAFKNIGYTQEFTGGEIYFERMTPNQGRIFVDIYYKADTGFNAPGINLNVNYLIQDTLSWSEKQILSKGLVLFRYIKDQSFFTSQNTVSIENLFALHEVANIDTPYYLDLFSIYENNAYWGVSNNSLPYFQNLQDSYYLEDGVLYYQLESEDLDAGHSVFFQYEWRLMDYATTESNYTLPEASNSISLDHESGLLVWDSPVQPGKYLFGFEVIEVLNEQFVIGRTKRYQIIEITEDDIVTSYGGSSLPNEKTLMIYPNPSSSIVSFDLSNFNRGVNISIIDVDGKEVYREESYDALMTDIFSINVEHWEKGVYFFCIQDKGRKIIVRRFFVD